MIAQNLAKWTGVTAFSIGISLLAALPAQCQEPAQPREPRAVVRISKHMIDDVASREEIVASLPLRDTIVGLRCQAMIDGRAKLSVEMTTADGDATFVVNSQGTAETYVRGVRGPIVATAPAWGTFATRTLVRFHGRNFTVVETMPWAEVHARLDRIEGRRGGPVGRVLGRAARPLGNMMIPRAEREATPIAERIVKNFVDELAGDIVAKLDRTTAVEKSLNRIFPETKDWVFQMSSNSRFLQTAYGPPGSFVPDLPENPGRLKDVRMELWLHSTSKEAQDLVKLSKLPLAKELVHRYVETTLPEMAAMTENRSFDSVGSWLVISFGAPKAR